MRKEARSKERIIRLVEFLFLTTVSDSIKMGKVMAKIVCRQICQLLSIFKDNVLEVSESISLKNRYFRTSALIISPLFIVSGQYLQLGADVWKTTTFFSTRKSLCSERCDSFQDRCSWPFPSLCKQAFLPCLWSFESGLLYDCSDQLNIVKLMLVGLLVGLLWLYQKKHYNFLLGLVDHVLWEKLAAMNKVHPLRSPCCSEDQPSCTKRPVREMPS